MQPIALVTQSEEFGQPDYDILRDAQEAGLCFPCVLVSNSLYSLSITAVSAALAPVFCCVEGMITMCHANYAKRISETDESCGYSTAEIQEEHMQHCRKFCCLEECLFYNSACSLTGSTLCPDSFRKCDCLFNDGKVCGRHSECCGGMPPGAENTVKRGPFYVNSMQADTPMVLMPIMLRS